jgi:hypothetical protein
MPIYIPADLNVAGATDFHKKLLAALDETGSAGSIQLDLADGAVTPLALQLLVSATRSFPTDRLELGSQAVIALTSIETPKGD